MLILLLQRRLPGAQTSFAVSRISTPASAPDTGQFFFAI
jgi:hypothetical protein